MAEATVIKNDNLNSQIMQFAGDLPYYTKYLSAKLLAGEEVNEEDINSSYTYFLQDAGLTTKLARPDIAITYDDSNSDFKKTLLLNSITNVEGVNALVEEQIIEFHPKLTIIYGVNGSGKSGYIRLLKQAFHSRTTEKILGNIHLDPENHKETKACFSFSADAEPYPFTYPDHEDQAEFKQFSIFDNKCVNIHLGKNKPEFRPAGLNFFANLNDAFKRLEEKIEIEADAKKTPKDYASLFDGDSAVKEFLTTLSPKTKILELKKHLPFTNEDKNKRTELEGQKVELQALKKDKEIGILTTNRQLLESLKATITDNNTRFSAEAFLAFQTAISDCVTKDNTAKNEGLENFKTNKLLEVGSAEWKAFIAAASKFAALQTVDSVPYPKDKDSCLFCQQPLSSEAKKLIDSYWVFIKSQAEQDAKTANGVLKTAKTVYDSLKFDLLPEDAVLTTWLAENHPEPLALIKKTLLLQKALAADVSTYLETKATTKRNAMVIDTNSIDIIVENIDTKIKDLKENDPTEDIKKLQRTITFLDHREKLEHHIDGIETYVACLQWADKAEKAAKANISRLQVTNKGKDLSAKFFNEAYVEAFNAECEALDGHFGIDISHTGASGASFKQLFMKGKNQPSLILSEGEQKVISLADFLAEMNLSEITRGIIFDDPVTSLDDGRKCLIANRIVHETSKKQVVVFTHDLVFVSTLISACNDTKTPFECHWMEKLDDRPGYIALRNSPSYENEYRNNVIPVKHYTKANGAGCSPEDKEYFIKAGFTALRTCYEVLVIHEMFSDVVLRFAERVSVDALQKVCFCRELANELSENFGQCCRYMEGHTHSDKFAYKKPNIKNLDEEIKRYDEIKKKIKGKKNADKKALAA